MLLLFSALGAFGRNAMALRHILLASAMFALSSAAVAQENTGIPCRVSWDETTHGGDWQTVHGDVELTQIMPQGGGSFMAMGTGQGIVTYHSAGPCGDDVANRTWNATYTVTVMSQDGRSAEVDIDSDDDPHQVVVCPSTGAFTFDAYAPSLPTVTAPLHEGATPFSQNHAGDHGPAGRAGTVTLHYCTLQNPNGH